MPNSKGFQLHDAAFLLLPPFARSLRWRVAYAMPGKKKKFKIQKHTVALKGEHCPTKTLCGGCAMALAAGRAPQEMSAAFPREDTGSPTPTATYKGFPAPAVTGSRMEKRRGSRTPSGSAVQRRV